MYRNEPGLVCQCVQQASCLPEAFLLCLPHSHCPTGGAHALGTVCGFCTVQLPSWPHHQIFPHSERRGYVLPSSGMRDGSGHHDDAQWRPGSAHLRGHGFVMLMAACVRRERGNQSYHHHRLRRARAQTITLALALAVVLHSRQSQAQALACSCVSPPHPHQAQVRASECCGVFPLPTIEARRSFHRSRLCADLFARDESIQEQAVPH